MILALPSLTETPASPNGLVRRRNGKPPSVSRLTEKKLIPFGWYGGKFSHLAWLLPLLPRCHHYCEPFAGSAAVLLNRFQSPVETYNDLDGEACNFFKVLRDHKAKLVEAIGLTPFSREEFALACTLDPEVSALERARRFYIRARQVRTGLAQTATVGRWANCKNTSRAGMSGVVSRWLGGVEMLPEIADRLLRVQIENRPAIDVIRLYDSPDTLFYCDPPYIHETRGDSKAYGHEMSDHQHCELAKVLNMVKGMVAISNYQCPLMDDLYSAPRWQKIVGPARTNHATKGTRVEVLWVNYKPQNAPMSKRAIAHLSSDPVMSGLIEKIGPIQLRPRRLQPFQSLAHAIIHQQLNSIAAGTILERFKRLFPGGGFPTPGQVAKSSVDRLRTAGLSRPKAAYIIDLAQRCNAGMMPSVNDCDSLNDEEIVARLTEIKGIGRWTVEMFLIFNLGRPDVLPVDDLGVRRGFQVAYRKRKMPTPEQLAKHGSRWAPHRTLAARYLWRAADAAENPNW